MNPSDSPTSDPTIHNPLEVMQPGEQIICEIKRHPIGIFGVYFISGALILAMAVLAFIAGPAVFSGNHGQALAISSILFLLVTSLLVAFVYIINKVYWGNSWVVTTDSITQIVQTSLFSKQSSQLSLGNLEDVTAEQRGFFPQMFNYGLLRAETAGERSKFIFSYCPNPNYYAKKVLAARENFEQQRRAERGGEQRLYRSEGAYQPQTIQQPNEYDLPPQPSQQVYQPPQQPPQQAPIFPNEPPAPTAESTNYPYEPPQPPK